MVDQVTAVTPYQLPEKTHVDSATASVFGSLLQENTAQFATLDTAQQIAKLMGGTVVDMNDKWMGGAQSSQYGIQMGSNGPVLNAGLIASRCQSCGVEAGLSATLVEAGSLAGRAISYSDAWSAIQANETVLSQAAAAAKAAAAPASITITPPQTAAKDATIAPVAADPTPSTSDLTVPVKQASDTKLADSAKQFESLMIGQMLKSVREASSNGWMDSESGGSQMSAVEFAETQLADAIASSGGFGLAKMVLTSLDTKNTATNSSSGS